MCSSNENWLLSYRIGFGLEGFAAHIIATFGQFYGYFGLARCSHIGRIEHFRFVVRNPRNVDVVVVWHGKCTQRSRRNKCCGTGLTLFYRNPHIVDVDSRLFFDGYFSMFAFNFAEIIFATDKQCGAANGYNHAKEFKVFHGMFFGYFCKYSAANNASGTKGKVRYIFSLLQ